MNSAIQQRFELWLNNATEDLDLVAELRNLDRALKAAKEKAGGKVSDEVKAIEAEIVSRFDTDLEFGTGGLRGMMGAGTNRMNHYTVARSTQGIAEFVNSAGSENPSVAIAYDSRNKSSYFAQVAARVLAANGIKCYKYGSLAPTPMLSYAVRRLKCNAGIMITASHNPKEYNGYKAYGSDGCQLSPNDSEAVIKRIESIDVFSGVKIMKYDKAFDSGIVTRVDDDVIDDYFEVVKNQAVNKGICEGAGLSVVYTPLNGAGNKPVRRIMREIGVADVTVVPEQEKPDGNFPTCPYPNPEFKEALELGLQLCEQEEPDLLIATDPDCDRVAIAARGSSGRYLLFSGNEVGAMMLEYICRERKKNGTLPHKAVASKSIVSTAIADKIAEKYGVEMINVLTGFKFIGEVAGNLEKSGEQSRFLFGFEESIGYMPGSYVRDKDAVCASMLICEMAAFYKKQGMTLVDARRDMYEEYGYYYHHTQNIAFEPGSAGMKKMSAIMDNLRRTMPKTVGDFEVSVFSDYLSRTVKFLKGRSDTKSTNLPKSNVIKLNLDGGSVVIIRPSGTEPKLKIYYTCIGATPEESVEIQEKVMAGVAKLI